MIRYVIAAGLGAAIGIGATLAVRKSPAGAATSATVTDSATIYPGILAVHHADSVATIAEDTKQLFALWDSAAVRIVPGGPPTVGRAAIFKEDSTFFAHHPKRKVLGYAPHSSVLSARGDIAVEWGYFNAAVVDRPGANPDSGTGNVLRVMRRQPNGEWKFSHVILNSRGAAR